MVKVPDDHPRAVSLHYRHKIIEGMKKKIVAEAGLIAHGRGEAYDYLIGEVTNDFAIQAIEAAAARIILSKKPILSVNGNTAVLCPEEMINLSISSGIPLEVNLFYRSQDRIDAIKEHFTQFEQLLILGLDPKYETIIEELSSMRRIVDKRGIKDADTVIVPLEDGDRTEALVRSDKFVITIDLNPLSRTAQTADITIIDNVVRVFPLLQNAINEISSQGEAGEILSKYDNKAILKQSLRRMSRNWEV